jgi:hypothetical protein
MGHLTPRARLDKLEQAGRPTQQRRIRLLLSLVLNDVAATRLAGRLARRMVDLGVFPGETQAERAAIDADPLLKDLNERLARRILELAADRGVEVEL